jgi:drug/metabolite transporter (DMT)-like permease
MATSRGSGRGLGLALLSAGTFASSGSFAASLLAAGWSPAAAVTVRVALAALVLTGPAVVQLRGRWPLLRRSAGPIALYGAVAVAGCQVFYFDAVQRLDVGVALLLEYLGGVLVVGWMWLRHGQRPRRLTLLGAAVAVVGLVLVLDLTGPVHLDGVGVLAGLGAAVGLAVYFVLSARTDDRLPPLVMAWAGLVVGAGFLALAGAARVVAWQSSTADVRFLDHRVSWLVPVLGLSLVAAVVAYTAGIAAARLLGPRLSSFVGLTEVVFAVLLAWLFLGQLPGPVQLAGGVVIVVGVAIVRADELRTPPQDRAGRTRSPSTATSSARGSGTKAPATRETSPAPSRGTSPAR